MQSYHRPVRKMRDLVCCGVISVFLLASTFVSGVSVREQTIDSVIQQTLSCHSNIPGLSVSVVKDGVTQYAKGFGFANLASKRPVTNTTLFGLASLSRSFSAVVLTKLLQAKNMSVYTRPADILGHQFQFKDPERNQYAGIRDLLAHTLGIASHNWMRFDDSLTRDNILQRVKYFDEVKPFRTAFVTNNLMYGVITKLTEVLGGKSWEEQIRREIYDQLGMDTSDFLTTVDVQKVDVATGYSDDIEDGGVVESPFSLSKHWGVLCGSTCIMSNAVDMAKWLHFHLSGGQNLNGQQVYDGDLLQQNYKPHNMIVSSTSKKYYSRPKAPVTNSISNYGFGWQNGHYRGIPIRTHTGTTWGYNSKTTLIPDKNIGIFTAMNGIDDNFMYRTLLHNYLADVYMGVDPYLNESTICSYPQPWFAPPSSKPLFHPATDKNVQASRPLIEYTGTYGNNAYGNITLQVDKTSNKLKMTYGVATWLLYPKQGVRNEFEAEGIQLIYKLFYMNTVKFSESHGHISSMSIVDFEYSDPPVFQRNLNSLGDLSSAVG